MERVQTYVVGVALKKECKVAGYDIGLKWNSAQRLIQLELKKRNKALQVGYDSVAERWLNQWSIPVWI